MNTEKHAYYLEMVHAMPTRTAAQKARKAKALEHLAAAIRPINPDCGGYGKAAELLAKSNGSKAKNYAKQGKSDCFVWIETEDGKRCRYNAECKTSGGRIASLRQANAPKYVVYSLDVCNKNTGYKRRVVEPKVMRTEYFLALLDSFHATKVTNGEHSEEAVQPSNKGLYLALLDYPVDYDPNATYYESDFDVD